MGVTLNVKRKFIVNGKEYNSLEEMPPDLRQAYAKAVSSGSGVRIQRPQVRVETKIVFNGKEYDSLGAMPADIRRVYQSVMKSVERGEASPELLSAALGDGSTPPRQGQATHTSIDISKPIEPVSAFSPRWIIAALVLISLVLGLYYLFAN
jgi:hypothetical protein